MYCVLALSCFLFTVSMDETSSKLYLFVTQQMKAKNTKIVATGIVDSQLKFFKVTKMPRALSDSFLS